MSQETSVDIVQEALATGASGYVAKADAASELLTALEAVLRGEKYVSGRVAARDLPHSKSILTEPHGAKRLLI